MREQVVTACCLDCGMPWSVGVHYASCPSLSREPANLTAEDVRRIVREELTHRLPQQESQ